MTAEQVGEGESVRSFFQSVPLAPFSSKGHTPEKGPRIFGSPPIRVRKKVRRLQNSKPADNIPVFVDVEQESHLQPQRRLDPPGVASSPRIGRNGCEV